MDSLIILQQMCVIGILVCIGIYLQKQQILTEESSKNISTILLVFTSPALTLSSVLTGNITATHGDLLKAICVAFVFYAFLCLLGVVLPILMPVEKGKRKLYNAMMVYTNVGFIGIPLARAILSDNAMLYVIVCNVMYSLLFYTHGVTVIGNNGKKMKLSSIFSPGTVMAILTLVVFWFDIQLPVIVTSTVTYVGNATVFLSMILLGASVARSPIMNGIRNINVWIYILVRMILVPVVLVLILNTMGIQKEMVQAFCLMAAMPIGSLPLIQAERVGEETETLSQAIVITTVACLFTITALMSVLF